MILFLAGVNCVGKTTLGPLMAADLDYPFFDLDRSMESFYGTKLAFLGKVIFPEAHEFRGAMAEVLTHLLTEAKGHAVIALNPPGLMDPVWEVIKKVEDKLIVLLLDEPENIVERVVYYDDDNKLIAIKPSAYMKKVLKKQVEDTLKFLKPSFKRADVIVDIAGCNIEQAWKKVLNETHTLHTKHRRMVPRKTG
jgi:shikimate kinase